MMFVVSAVLELLLLLLLLLGLLLMKAMGENEYEAADEGEIELWLMPVCSMIPKWRHRNSWRSIVGKKNSDGKIAEILGLKNDVGAFYKAPKSSPIFWVRLFEDFFLLLKLYQNLTSRTFGLIFCIVTKQIKLLTIVI